MALISNQSKKLCVVGFISFLWCVLTLMVVIVDDLMAWCYSCHVLGFVLFYCLFGGCQSGYCFPLLPQYF